MQICLKHQKTVKHSVVSHRFTDFWFTIPIQLQFTFAIFLKLALTMKNIFFWWQKILSLEGEKLSFVSIFCLPFWNIILERRNWQGFWTFTNFFNIYFNVSMLSIKYLVPAWKIILSILKFPLKLACISLRIMWLVAPE